VNQPRSLARRRLLQRFILGVPAAAVALARAGEVHTAALPLLSPAAADAKKVHYAEDASQDKRAPKGATCGNCALYQGASGSSQGPCQLFPGRDVQAKGWCSSWAPQI
jgi:hypothetical protein